jgi:hypothetical protein
MHSLHVLIAFVVDRGNRNWPEAIISGQSYNIWTESSIFGQTVRYLWPDWPENKPVWRIDTTGKAYSPPGCSTLAVMFATLSRAM